MRTWSESQICTSEWCLESVLKVFVFLYLVVRHMAEIVEEQGGHVDTVHKATVESHARAEAGLEQVKQAASYQPTCVIS
jgi:t-SNARE complex subunit (syntaxin)